MRNQSFYSLFGQEVNTQGVALLGLYEKKDRLLYVEAPQIRKRYMEAVGNFEEGVLNDELELSLLHRKAELIQIAINRREPIDLEAIDKELEREREERISAVENADLTLKEFSELSEEELKNMQSQYHDITTEFHPAINTDITDAQKELYAKAVEAYKNQDAEAISIIHSLLFESYGNLNLSYSIKPESEESNPREEYRAEAMALSTDYTLAKKLYRFFVPLEEDYIILNKVELFKSKAKIVHEEIEKIRNSFPFNALPMLSSQEKIDEYMAELRIRGKICANEKQELEKKIMNLTGGTVNG